MDTKYIIAEPNQCCGCGVCMAVCPTNAISMKEDELGFIMPVLDHNVCVNCGKCRSRCAFINPEKFISDTFPVKTYAAALKNESIIKQSASGGVFAGASEKILTNGGFVYGASYSKGFLVKHVEIKENSQLSFLQGSKYTQSMTCSIWSKIKQRLDDGKTVLFSGTPCQVAALKGYLGKEYQNLYTIDLICHGVGSPKMFKDDLHYLGAKYKSKVISVSFRSKRKGWGTNGDLVLQKRIVDYGPANSPYYYYYLDSSIFRDSCYHCPYATQKRVGDITIGDFWRFETLVSNSKINISKGVSCLIVNTQKGLSLLEMIKDSFELIETQYDDIVKRNGNLRQSSTPSPNRMRLLKIYKEAGYKGLVEFYKKEAFLKRIVLKINGMIPRSVKVMIKRIRSMN